MVLFDGHIFVYLIFRSNFGNRTVEIEMKKKEVRGGPGGIVSMAEFIDVSALYCVCVCVYSRTFMAVTQSY